MNDYRLQIGTRCYETGLRGAGQRLDWCLFLVLDNCIRGGCGDRPQQAELYRYDGHDYPPQRDTGPAPACRVEIGPSKRSSTDFFLHVLTAFDATVATVPMALLVQTASTVRVQVGQATISFAKQKLDCAIEVPWKNG